ncbi:carboxylate-amine ligase [Actinomadura scrupuli]|uniref:carboxylate-amine ligase n=1 Tax=Actinomadura scrupuli TaxID=559629 RepID=UPI003D957916
MRGGQAASAFPAAGVEVPARGGADGATMGVEEEFLLVDPLSRRSVAGAPGVLARAAARPGAPGTALHAELLGTQVEAATGVCADLAELRRQVRDGRLRLARAAREEGVRLISSGTPVLPGASQSCTPGDRFARISGLYEGVVSTYEACGCHVHVGVADQETAVAVVNHLRPWLPALLALSVNSPFDQGADSGYGSWRMLDQARFPGSGIPPRFPSAAAYTAQLDRLVELGVLVDSTMTFWLARPSPRWPTVEIRAADAAATVDEAVLQAALARALVRTALADLAAGREAPAPGDQICAAAVWSAARYGMDGPAVHLLEERRVPAGRLLAELLDRVDPALEETGDRAEVRALVAGVLRRGTGAARQRRAAAEGPRAVVDMLVEQTVRGDDAVRPPDQAVSGESVRSGSMRMRSI